MHPVLNLASARLIAGTPGNPEAVGAAAITMPNGPLLGMRALGSLDDAAPIDYLQEQLQIGDVVGHSITVLKSPQAQQHSA